MSSNYSVPIEIILSKMLNFIHVGASNHRWRILTLSAQIRMIDGLEA